MDTATAQQLIAALVASGFTLPTLPVPQKTGDDPTNDTVSKDISWQDFWKKVNEIIGKDVLPPVAMQFASSLKEMRDMNSWKNNEILDAYKTWTPVDKEKAKAEKEAKKAEKEAKKVEKEVKEKAKLDAKAEKELKAKAKDAKAKEAEDAKAKAEDAKAKAEEAKEAKAKAKEAEDAKAKEAKAKEAEEAKAKEAEEAKTKEAEEAKAKEAKEAKEAKAADTDKKISKKVKTDVWNTFIGEGIANHKCLCCKMTTIDKAEFDCGHVVSKAQGGGPEIHNLRPICSACNNGMKTMNMIDYVKEHGYYIGGGR
jgi:hypothetical protein